jgi:prepilin-type N-terminal cleavage/methylation domain-containing protein
MNRKWDGSRTARRGGFTLVELLTVIIIISIILGFIVVASMDATHRAEERATQALITKLEQGLNDRLEALLQVRPEPNYSHGYLAAIYNGTQAIPSLTLPTDSTQPNPAVRTTERAQIIAWYDFIRSEMPDVFFVQDTSGSTNSYPLNFAAVPFLTGGTTPTPLNYVLPLGNSQVGPFTTNNQNFGDGLTTFPSLGNAGSGIYGASYGAAAGFYKNLGYQPAGYDGVDNDNNGFVDNWGENNFTSAQSQVVLGNIGRHTHNTARAEALYAILVEGSGPLGSIFNRDDFTDKEVQDTDGDGMPEFVDAWGNPIQFFRWPIYYHSDLQRGQTIAPDTSVSQQWDLIPPYVSMLEQREQNTLDPNQQLLAPGWYSTTGSGGIAANSQYQSDLIPWSTQVPTGASGGVQAFGALFHSLNEPLPSPPGGALYWDRGGTYPYRRAFYSKFLILSGGLDQQPGVFLYSDTALAEAGSDKAGVPNASKMLIANENNAMPFGMDLFGSGTSSSPNAGFVSSVSIPASGTGTYPSFTSSGTSGDPSYPYTYDLMQSAGDDISNHNITSGGSIGGSG